MNALQWILWRLIIVEFLLIKLPELLQETETTIDTVRIPRLTCFYRTEEHFVKTEGICAILLNNNIWIDNVEHRLWHLLYRPTAFVGGGCWVLGVDEFWWWCAIFEDEFSIVILWTPCLESLNIQYISMNNVDINMDRSSIILVFLPQADKYWCLWVVVRVDTINEVRASLDHSLVHQLFVWFLFTTATTVEEELIPETTVNQVTCCMFGTTDVKVYILPILVCLFAHKCFVIVWVHVTKIVCWATCEARHCIQLQWEYSLIVNQWLLNNLTLSLIPSPNLSTTQWWFATFCWFVLVDFRQFKRQTLLWYHVRHSLLVIDWEWFTPVTLAWEDSITQTIVHLHTTDTLLSNKLLCLRNSLLHRKTIEREAVHTLFSCSRRVGYDSFLCIKALFWDISTLNQWDDWEVEMLCKGIVTTVVSRHSHNRSRSIASQNILWNPNRNLLTSEWIDTVWAWEDTCHLTVRHTL